MAKEKEKILDFGEEISGARKHMYEHLKIDDIDEMSSIERSAYVKIDNIWKMRTCLC